MSSQGMPSSQNFLSQEKSEIVEVGRKGRSQRALSIRWGWEKAGCPPTLCGPPGCWARGPGVSLYLQSPPFHGNRVPAEPSVVRGWSHSFTLRQHLKFYFSNHILLEPKTWKDQRPEIWNYSNGSESLGEFDPNHEEFLFVRVWKAFSVCHCRCDAR